MQQAQVSNPKDDVVVTFHNSTDFDFTPEMGCMYDGRSINGMSGNPGIATGEKKMLPYHIGHRLSVNLAKRVLNTSPAATVDAAGVPTGVPIWSSEKLEELAKTFVHEEYADQKPAAQTDTDKLMAKMLELEEFVKNNVASGEISKETEPAKDETVSEEEKPSEKVEYLDKAEVIAELTKRGIKFDARSTKDNLEKLLK